MEARGLVRHLRVTGLPPPPSPDDQIVTQGCVMPLAGLFFTGTGIAGPVGKSDWSGGYDTQVGIAFVVIGLLLLAGFWGFIKHGP